MSASDGKNEFKAYIVGVVGKSVQFITHRKFVAPYMNYVSGAFVAPELNRPSSLAYYEANLWGDTSIEGMPPGYKFHFNEVPNLGFMNFNAVIADGKTTHPFSPHIQAVPVTLRLDKRGSIRKAVVPATYQLNVFTNTHVSLLKAHYELSKSWKPEGNTQPFCGIVSPKTDSFDSSTGYINGVFTTPLCKNVVNFQEYVGRSGHASRWLSDFYVVAYGSAIDKNVPFVDVTSSYLVSYPNLTSYCLTVF